MSENALWGIAPQIFLSVYVGLAVFVVGWRLTWNLFQRSEVQIAPRDVLLPVELGLLVSRRNAVLVALTELRQAGLLSDEGRPQRNSTSVIANLHPFTQAVLAAADTNGPLGKVRLLTSLGPAFRDLTADLIRRGYIAAPPSAITRIPVAATLLLGMVRLVSSIVVGQFEWPVGVVVAVVVVFSVGRERLTAQGRAARAEHERSNQHLAPERRPAMDAYGAHAAAIGVALFGLPMLLHCDPDLGANIGDLGLSSDSAGGGGCGGGCGGDGGGGGGGCGGCGGCGG